MQDKSERLLEPVHKEILFERNSKNKSKHETRVVLFVVLTKFIVNESKLEFTSGFVV